MCDQLTSYYARDRKSKRNYMRLIFDLLELLLFNGWVCHKKKMGNDKLPLLHYRNAVIKGLAKPETERRAPPPVAWYLPLHTCQS